MKDPHDIPGETIEQRIQRQWRGMCDDRSRLDNACRRELDFALRLAHYVQGDDNELDQRRMQPRGQQLYSLIRRKSGEIARSQSSVQVRPLDRLSDPKRGEYVKWAIQYVKDDQFKDYTSCRDRMVVGALAARAWAVAIDFDPNMGPFGGEIQFRSCEPWRWHWTGGYFSPHDPRCSTVIEEVDLTYEELERQAGWKLDEELIPDNGSNPGLPTTYGEPTGAPGQVKVQGRGGQSLNDEPTYKILKVWIRNDQTRRSKPRKNSLRELPPEEHYIGCEACGYRGPRQGEVGVEIPAVVGPCPECGDMLMRMEFEEVIDTYAGYPNGRYLVIPAFGTKKLVDTDWPNRTRSVPLYWWTAYVDPREVMGQSDTSLNKSSQQMSNGLDRMAYEQMQENRSYYALPQGVEDFAGRPFVMADAQGRVMFKNADYDPHRNKGIEQFQGAGLSKDWAILKQSVTRDMDSYQGSTDLGIKPGDSKDIAVGTMDRLMASVAVPTEHHVRRLLHAESQGDSVLLDIIRDTWTEPRWVRYRGYDGRDAYQLMRGMDIPAADVVVTSPPVSEAVSQEKLQVFQILTNPQFVMYRQALAHFLNVDPSTVKMIEEAEKSAQMNGQLNPMGATQGGGTPNADALISSMFGGGMTNG